MDRFRDDQVYIPVNTRAGIPPAGGNLIDRLDRNHIHSCAVVNQLICNIECKTAVPIVMLTNIVAIDIDIGVGVYTVEVQRNLLP